jgi:hypothetical protein
VRSSFSAARKSISVLAPILMDGILFARAIRRPVQCVMPTMVANWGREINLSRNYAA